MAYSSDFISKLNDELTKSVNAAEDFLKSNLAEFETMMKNKAGFCVVVGDMLKVANDRTSTLKSAMYKLEAFLAKNALMPGLSRAPSAKMRYDMTPEAIWDAWQTRFLSKDEIKFR